MGRYMKGLAGIREVNASLEQGTSLIDHSTINGDNGRAFFAISLCFALVEDEGASLFVVLDSPASKGEALGSLGLLLLDYLRQSHEFCVSQSEFSLRPF